LEVFGHEGAADLTTREQCEMLAQSRQQLDQFRKLLIHVTHTRTAALLEVARHRLDEDDLQRCQTEEHGYDRFALLIRLVLRCKQYIDEVVSREVLEMYGFAQMIPMKPPSGKPALAVGKFLTRDNIDAVLRQQGAHASSCQLAEPGPEGLWWVLV